MGSQVNVGWPKDGVFRAAAARGWSLGAVGPWRVGAGQRHHFPVPEMRSPVRA